MGLQDESTTSLVKKAAIAVIAVAFLLHLISFSSTHWASTNHNVERRDHIGLWRKCSQVKTSGGGYKEVCSDYIDLLTEDWLKTSQAFMTLGMFAALASVGGLTAFVLVPSFQQNLKMLAGVVAVIFVTCAFTGIALAAFSARYAGYYSKIDEAYEPDVVSLGWSWYMGLTAGAMIVTALGMVIPDTFFPSDDDVFTSSSRKTDKRQQPKV